MGTSCIFLMSRQVPMTLLQTVAKLSLSNNSYRDRRVAASLSASVGHFTWA